MAMIPTRILVKVKGMIRISMPTRMKTKALRTSSRICQKSKRPSCRVFVPSRPIWRKPLPTTKPTMTIAMGADIPSTNEKS